MDLDFALFASESGVPMKASTRQSVDRQRVGTDAPDLGAGHTPQLQTMVLLGSLTLLTTVAFAPTAHNGFVPYDDQVYITKNPFVQAGLTRTGIVWAFSSFGYGSNWHPLTWLSHMLDMELFGPAPGAHHLVSLGFHVISAVLLALAFSRAFGSLLTGVAIGALFALHPLHVESVAWAAERKDVLSGFFVSLSLLLYVWYARRASLQRWLLVTLSFGCALLSKPTVVTLPGLLLLLDYWPLGRLLRPRDGRPRPHLRGVLLEKAPWFVMAAAAATVTLLVQLTTGAGNLVTPMPLPVRVAHAAVSYGWYLAKTFWPANLTFFYPHPAELPPPAHLAAAVAGICAVSWVAVSRRKEYPHLLVGWVWYLVALLPMIGIIQVGAQAWADRYSYLPLSGVFLALSWQLCRFLRRRRATLAATAVAAVLAVCVLASNQQVRVWRDGDTLLRAALGVNPRNTVALVGMGRLHLDQKRYDEAASFFREAIRLRPTEVEAYLGMGVYYGALGLAKEEAATYEQGLVAVPENPRLLYNLVLVYRDLGKWKEALTVNQQLQAIVEKRRGKWYSRGFR